VCPWGHATSVPAGYKGCSTSLSTRP
jgi:hypothetical protein